MKKIEICEDLGFCHGVRNAIWSSVQSFGISENVFILGNLIHNERVLEELSLSKVKFIKEVNELPINAKVIIPAHGVKKEVFKMIKEKTPNFIDMTCPVVIRLRNSLINFYKKDYFVLLLGRKEHPEIVGVTSYIKDENYAVIENTADIKKLEKYLKLKDRIVLLSQTTANYEKYTEIANYLKTLDIAELEIYNTICPTVVNREINTLKLSEKVDIMFVLGDKRSSNTLSLLDMSCRNTESILLESNKPLSSQLTFREKLKNVNTIGITAGTSTPYYVVEEFSEAIKNQMSESSNNPVVVIYGPTACGKTEIVDKLALKINGEIISCDSMQIYKNLDIGTAKPDLSKCNVPYHLVDILSLNEQFSVAEYRKLANESINKVKSNKRIPIIAGGSYLYLSSIIDGLFEIDKSFDPDIRKDLTERINYDGLDSLYQELCKIDPETAKKIGRNDSKRIIRALEVYKVTGRTISSLKKENTFPLPYFFIKIGLVRPTSELYERIDRRVDKMIEDGLIEEIKNLFENHFETDLERIKPHGYREMIKYVKGEMSLNDATELMKKNTRNYAKRQMSWLRQRSDFHLLNLSSNSNDETIESIVKIIELSKTMIKV